MTQTKKELLMRKILILFGLMATTAGFSQIDYPESSGSVFEKQHEIRLGAIRLLAGHSLDIGYERIIDRNQGYGVNLLIGFADESEDRSEGFKQIISVSPYYRFYFNKSQEYGAKGMFIEGFADFYNGKSWDTVYTSWNNTYDYFNEEKYFEIAAGLALGWKWVNTAGFIFEIKLGFGRNLLGNAPDEGIFRGDFSIGYRF